MVLLISFIVSIFWIGVLHRFDSKSRFKSNKRAVSGFFIYGLLSVPFVLLIYEFAIPITTPILTIYPKFEMFVLVGPAEEIGKFLVFYLGAISAGAIKEPKDGVLHAASVGLAFSIIENILYSIYGIQTLLIRSVTGTLGHMSYAIIWGYAAGVYVYSKKAGMKAFDFSLVISSIIIAAFFHGLFNFILGEFGLFAGILVKVVSVSIALITINHLDKVSPFEPIPFYEYREAIPHLKMAIASNPESFILHKRLGLHLLRAGQMNNARQMLKKATDLSKKDLSSKIYISLIDILTDNDRGTSLSHFADKSKKLSLNNLKKLKKQMREVFAGNNRKDYVLSLIDDEIANKKGISQQQKISREYDNQSTLSAHTLKRDPVQHKKKLNAASRIIDNKQKELSRK